MMLCHEWLGIQILLPSQILLLYVATCKAKKQCLICALLFSDQGIQTSSSGALVPVNSMPSAVAVKPTVPVYTGEIQNIQHFHESECIILLAQKLSIKTKSSDKVN